MSNESNTSRLAHLDELNATLDEAYTPLPTIEHNQTDAAFGVLFCLAAVVPFWSMLVLTW